MLGARLGDEGEGAVGERGDHHRDRHPRLHVLRRRVEVLAELHDVEPALAERGADGRRGVRLAGRNLQLDVAGDLLRHIPGPSSVLGPGTAVQTAWPPRNRRWDSLPRSDGWAAFSGRGGRVQRRWSLQGRSVLPVTSSDRPPRLAAEQPNVIMRISGNCEPESRRPFARHAARRHGQPSPSQSEAPLPRRPTTLHRARLPSPAPAARWRARRPDPPSADTAAPDPAAQPRDALRISSLAPA